MYKPLVKRLMKAIPKLVRAVFLVMVFHLLSQVVISSFRPDENKFSSSSGISSKSSLNRFLHSIDKKLLFYNSQRPSRPRTARPTRSTPTPSTTSPLPPPPLYELQSIQDHRLFLLKQECKRLENERGKDVSDMKNFMIKHNFPTRPLWTKIFYVKEEQLSFCPNFKAASTFILKKLLVLAPSGMYNKTSVKTLDGQANVLARKEFSYLKSWEQYQFTKDGTTFMFVRHPFERLLSAFRDKLEDPAVQGKGHNEFYYKKYGKRIVKMYREQYKEQITGPEHKYPSFLEFVRFIIERDYRHDDEHWAPYFMSCSPCHIPFNFIGHFETMYWDIVHLANKTGLTEQWVDPSDYHQFSTSSEVTRSYYNQLDTETIRKLYERYKVDFDMFGYGIDEFIGGSTNSDVNSQHEIETSSNQEVNEKNTSNDTYNTEIEKLNMADNEDSSQEDIK